MFSLFLPFPKVQKWVFSFFWFLATIVIFFKTKYNVLFGIEVAISTLQTIREPKVGLALIDTSFFLWLIFITFPPIIASFFVNIQIKNQKKSYIVSFIVFFLFSILTFVLIFKQGGFAKWQYKNNNSASHINEGKVKMHEVIFPPKGYYVKGYSITPSLSYFSPFDFIVFMTRAINLEKKTEKTLQ